MRTLSISSKKGLRNRPLLRSLLLKRSSIMFISMIAIIMNQ